MTLRATLSADGNNHLKTKVMKGRMRRAKRRVSGLIGMQIRQTARKSMKRGARYTSESQLSPQELFLYKKARRRWHRGGEVFAQPKLPHLHSRPGTPPHVINGAIKNFLLYDKDYVKNGVAGVIVGPRIFIGKGANKGKGAKLQELGGQGESTIQSITANFPKRPYMGPALRKALPNIRTWWKGAFLK